jgi:hypothetical protein
MSLPIPEGEQIHRGGRLTAGALDNSEKPVACFEGPESIFRGHRGGFR